MNDPEKQKAKDAEEKADRMMATLGLLSVESRLHLDKESCCLKHDTQEFLGEHGKTTELTNELLGAMLLSAVHYLVEAGGDKMKQVDQMRALYHKRKSARAKELQDNAAKENADA